MTYLRIEDFTRERVDNPRMLLPGGTVGLGSYTRTRKNTPISPGLLARMEYTARVMIENCRLADKCVPKGMPGAVGAPVPGQPDKRYVDCTDEERVRRLIDARNCAITQLSTEGGRYSRRPT